MSALHFEILAHAIKQMGPMLAESNQPQILQATGTDDSDLPYSDFYSGQDAKLCAVSATKKKKLSRISRWRVRRYAAQCESMRLSANMHQMQL